MTEPRASSIREPARALGSRPAPRSSATSWTPTTSSTNKLGSSPKHTPRSTAAVDPRRQDSDSASSSRPPSASPSYTDEAQSAFSYHWPTTV